MITMVVTLSPMFDDDGDGRRRLLRILDISRILKIPLLTTNLRFFLVFFFFFLMHYIFNGSI